MLVRSVFKNISVGAQIHWRNKESATDEATSLFAVQEFLSQHKEVDVVFLIQCTSPFIQKQFLINGLQCLKLGKDCAFAITVYVFDFF